MKKLIALAALLATLLAVPALAATSSPLQVQSSGTLAGTIATGGTFQSLFSLTTARTGCAIVNPPTATETLYVHLGSATATTSNSIPLSPGGAFSCNFGSVVLQDAVSVSAVTTNHAFIYLSM